MAAPTPCIASALYLDPAILRDAIDVSVETAVAVTISPSVGDPTPSEPEETLLGDALCEVGAVAIGVCVGAGEFTLLVDRTVGAVLCI